MAKPTIKIVADVAPETAKLLQAVAVRSKQSKRAVLEAAIRLYAAQA